MKYKNSYVSKDKELKPLKKVLKQWLKLNDRYYDYLGDIVSCYTELSSVSHFNAAAWSCQNDDWVGLQEYQAEKRENTRGRRKIKNGRVDLYLSNSEIDYAIEAKKCFVNINKVPSGKLIEKLENEVWKAWDDSKKIKNQQEAQVRLAITFFDFQSPCNDVVTEKEITKTVKEYTELINENLFDAGAFWFLEKPLVEDEWAYSGTFLVVEKYI